MKLDFLKKINDRSIVIGVIGLGYVGLPLGEAYVKKGIKVIGFDINEKRVAQLNSGVSGMNNIADSRVKNIVESGNFQATTDIQALKHADALLICVPTPLDNYHHPDLSYVEKTCRTLSTILREGQLVVLESTTFPGTTTDIVAPILEESGLKSGKDFAVAYSPEREDPGNAKYETSTIPKLVGADSSDERDMAEAVYDLIVKTILVPNTRTAEAAKLTENIFRWVNIGLVNELKLVFEKMDIDVWDVVKAADSKPFGFMAFYPGPGVGGHCIRVDPYYLTWKAREHGVSTRFIELAGEININMPKYVIHRLMEELNTRQKKALSQCNILLCGMSYKKNINDLRESPSLELLKILLEFGANVDYYDPFIPEIPRLADYPEFEGRKSIGWKEDKLSDYDAVIIATGHTNVDYETIARQCPLIIDTRNVYNNLSDEFRDKVAKA